MLTNRLLLAKELSFLSTDHIMINKFTKTSSDLMTYQTTRSAFIIPIKGKAEILFDNESFVAFPGKVIYGSPNKKISFKIIGNEPFEHINLYYTLVPDTYSKSACLNSTFELTMNAVSQFHALLEKLYRLYHSSNNKDEFQKEVLLHSLFTLLFPEFSSLDEQKQLIDASVEYIKKNYATPLTLEALSKQFNKTPNQFSYLFNKYMGLRPVDYIIQYRLKVALALLKQGAQVKEAALSVGYQDAYYFSRLFKKHFHLAPSQIKKQHTLFKEVDSTQNDLYKN